MLDRIASFFLRNSLVLLVVVLTCFSVLTIASGQVEDNNRYEWFYKTFSTIQERSALLSTLPDTSYQYKVEYRSLSYLIDEYNTLSGTVKSWRCYDLPKTLDIARIVR